MHFSALRRATGLVSAMVFALVFTPAMAGTHYLKPTSGQPELYWSASLQVEGGGVEFIAEELDFNEPGNPWNPRQVVLYRGLNKATVKASFQYQGSYNLVSGSTKVNRVSGDELAGTLDLTDPSAEVAYGGWYVVTAIAESIGPDGEPFYINLENSFYADLRVYKALGVELRSIGSTGARAVTTRRSPHIDLNPETGVHSINVSYSDWGPASIQLDALGPIQVAETGSQQTDDNGSLTLNVVASTVNGGGESGWVSGGFRLRASRDGCEMERTDSLSLPFAVVTSSTNAWIVHGDGIGESVEPLYGGRPLPADSKIQVGSTTGGAGVVGIRFCNGQKHTLSAEPLQGYRAIIGGPDSIQTGPMLLGIRLKSIVQEITDDPRRFGRMRVYKAVGGAIDTALGIPNPVGWTVTTPGGAVESYLADWGETAYTPPPPPRKWSLEPRSKEGSFAQPLAAPPPLAVPTWTTFDFYSDGSVWVEQLGGGSVQISGPGGTTSVRAGGATLVRQGQPGVACTSTTAAQAPAPWTIGVLPTSGTTVTTRTPPLTVQVPAYEAVVWETLSVRLDGREVSTRFPTQGDGTTLWTPGPADALAAGPHSLTARIQTLKGDVLAATTQFHVEAAPPAVPHVTAMAFHGGVWITWTPATAKEPLRYSVLREPAGGGGAVVVGSNLTQPGFLDAAPLASALYTVRTVDPSSGFTADAYSVAADWSTALPPAPEPAGAEIPVLLALNEGIQIRFRNRSGFWGRFRLERAMAPEGPFVDIQPGEWTVAETVLDSGVAAGQDYYYRLTPLSADGTPGAPTLASPVHSRDLPASPDSLRVHTVTGAVPGAIIGWDPPTDLVSTRIHVQRDSGSGFEQIADLPATTSSFFDPAYRAGRSWLYRAVASRDDGTEGTAAMTGAAAVHEVAPAPARIGFAVPQLEVAESTGDAQLILTREGNLSEPAMIGYRAERNYDDQANPGEDFTPVRGWITFAPGESNATVPLPILPDSIYEYDERFSVSLWSVLGATEPAGPVPGRILIKDQDLILPKDYVTNLATMENAGSVVVPLMRLYPSNRTVSVEIAVSTSGTTAVEGTDYGPFTSGRVEFASGATLGTLSIPLQDDMVKDGTKLLVLNLQDPLGGCSISEWQQTLTVSLRDDETHAGQMRFSLAVPILITPRGGDRIIVPVTRTDGTDGAIGAMVMMGGGSLPFEAILSLTSTLSLGEGETTAAVSIQVDPAQFDPRVAPFLILDPMNAEHPNRNSQVLVIFPHAAAPAGGFAAWANREGLPPGTTPSNDHDHDGGCELAEFALGTSPLDGAQIPAGSFARDNWGGLGLQRWVRADPDLVAVAEFSENLDGSFPKLNAGYREWPTTPDGGIAVSYFHYPAAGTPAVFGRLRFIYLGNP